jgi:hypothetical protein
MDRLSVSMAICRGRRLHHGQPFVVFALDLRDPLGSYLAQILHALGDSRRTEDLMKRAERRERAPVVVVPASQRHAREVLRRLESTPDLDARQGCTPGDVQALRAFVEGVRWPGSGVSVFLAADDERSVFLFPHRLKGKSVEMIVGLRAQNAPANTNVVPLVPEHDMIVEDDDPVLTDRAPLLLDGGWGGAGPETSA